MCDKKVRGVLYRRDKNNFLKQKDPKPFDYTLGYKYKQSTNVQMSWLRMGWLLAHISYEDLRTMRMVDIGSGNGIFVREAKQLFRISSPYDVVGNSISKEELCATKWDLVIMSDVLEHYLNIDDFWNLKFDYAMISYPETPHGIDLTKWRHMKPDEHIYLLDRDSFKDWVEYHGCTVVGYGTPEDAIRKRWDDQYINISTFLIKRGGYGN